MTVLVDVAVASILERPSFLLLRVLLLLLFRLPGPALFLFFTSFLLLTLLEKGSLGLFRRKVC